MRRQAIYGAEAGVRAMGAGATNTGFAGYTDGDGGSHTSATESYSEEDYGDDLAYARDTMMDL
jgi:hypothetical protein